MDTTLTIRIDDKLDRLLEERARRSGQSKSELVRDSLRRQLQVHSFKELRNELLPYGDARNWLTDEDVFDNVS